MEEAQAKTIMRTHSPTAIHSHSQMKSLITITATCNSNNSNRVVILRSFNKKMRRLRVKMMSYNNLRKNCKI